MHDHSHGHSHGHDHGHGHSHRPDPDAGAATRRALKIALVLNAAFLVVEVGIGLWTGSLALLSDAAHMVSDVGALALALGAAQLALQAATPGRSYGWLRAETLGAFINGLALFVACGFITFEAVHRLVGGAPHIDGWPVLLAGATGLAINVGSAVALMRADRGNLGVKGALLHMIFDAVGSVGAMISAGFLLAGVNAADAAVSLFIAALVLWGASGLLRDAGRVLLQFAPAGLAPEDVRAGLLQTEGVADVHDLHLWSLDGRTAILSAHLVAAPGVPAKRARGSAEATLSARFGIAHTTLQIEEQGECAHTDCALWVPPAGRAASSTSPR